MCIQGAGKTTAYVYNLTGKQIAATSVDGYAEVRTPAGVYIVRVGQHTAKIIVR